MVEARDGGHRLQDRVVVLPQRSVRHLEDAHRRRRQQRHLLLISVFTLHRTGACSGGSQVHIAGAAAAAAAAAGWRLFLLVLLRLLLLLALVVVVVAGASRKAVGRRHQTVGGRIGQLHHVHGRGRRSQLDHVQSFEIGHGPLQPAAVLQLLHLLQQDVGAEVVLAVEELVLGARPRRPR